MIDRVWSSKECACCACDPSVHISVPSIGYVFVCRKLSPHLKEFRVCSHVVSLCDVAYYVIGYEHTIAVHLTLWYVVLVCHQYDVCKNYVGNVYMVGMVV